MTANRSYKTEQETFWAGSFGEDYIKRNLGPELLASNLRFFSRALRSARKIQSCIEFGANIGMNLKALKLLYPFQEQHAVELNTIAANELKTFLDAENVNECSMLDFSSPHTWDLVLIKGVLIHINPDELPSVYEKLANACRRYLLVAEYYNPTPVAIPYRGHNDRLFKRDFAGEIMAGHVELKLVDYGFSYRRDPDFPQDDITWFLMEKAGQ